MKQFLLDTNICIYFMKGKYNLLDKINSVSANNCYISEITVAELKYGCENSKFSLENSKTLKGFLTQFQILPIFSSLEIYAKEKARLRSSGQIIDDFDLLIAATAVFNDLVLVTNNISHFSRIQNIQLENWTI